MIKLTSTSTSHQASNRYLCRRGCIVGVDILITGEERNGGRGRREEVQITVEEGEEGLWEASGEEAPARESVTAGVRGRVEAERAGERKKRTSSCITSGKGG
jgi:hypothetical protein